MKSLIHILAAALLATLAAVPALAQHDHSGHSQAAKTAEPKKAQKPKAKPRPAAQPARPATDAPATERQAEAPVRQDAPAATGTTADTGARQDTARQAAPGHEMHGHQPGTALADSAHAEGVHPAGHGEGMAMSNAFSLSLPMNRNGSGTGWLPDATPMYGYMAHAGRWMFMFHGNVFLRYNHQDVFRKGSRGDSKVDAPNWLMGMGQRQVGRNGLFRFSAMLSLDPLFGGEGYPLLFQTGETYKGRPLVDRQHPHNFFSELSVAYTHRFSQDLDLTAYFGLPGEPALGPVAFMHRISSMNTLDAPLGHHWQDATHITFGVATLGLRYRNVRLEGSSFTGREPGEARYGIDRPRFDSYSGRLSWAVSPALVVQASQAYLVSPEAVDPDENVRRTTASAIHSLVLPGTERILSTTAVWGYNNAGHGHEEHSALLESNLQLNRLALYGRGEWIEKSADELLLAEQFGDHTLFRIGGLTLGSSFRIAELAKTRLSIGAQGTLYMPPASLAPIYGKNPIAAQVYLRLWPGLMAGPAGR